jgi:hypothetical protein
MLSENISAFQPLLGTAKYPDSVAEWSKALVLGTSLFGGVGSNPTAVTQILSVISQYIKRSGYKED